MERRVPTNHRGDPPRALLWNITARELELTVFTHESQMPGGVRVSKSPLQELFAVHIPGRTTGHGPSSHPQTPSTRLTRSRWKNAPTFPSPGHIWRYSRGRARHGT